MKNIIKIIFVFFLFTLVSFSQENSCKSFIENQKFTYKLDKKNVLVIFKNDKCIEYHDNKKYFIKSDIIWISNCEYNLVIRENNLPSFPFTSGTKLNVKIKKIKGNKMFYIGTLDGRSWESKMVKYKTQ